MKERLRIPDALDGYLWPYHWKGQTHPMHRHDELEFNLVTRGTARYLFRERRQELGRHDLIWLFPAQEHILIDRTRNFSMWIAVFRPRLLRRVCRRDATKVLRAEDPQGGFCRRLSSAAVARLEALMHELRSAIPDVERFNAGLPYLLLEVWNAYASADESQAGAAVHPAVEQAAQELRGGNLELGVEALAAKVGLSPNRLSRLFKRQLGVSLTEFRNRQRVERFLRLYGDGQRTSMLDAALGAGFGSYAQFYRVFKQQTGHAPRAWQRVEDAD
ncbi:MAG: AraC family transcriptional regulator [Planctomycetota bacterium]|nr:AraC family transcriptional regulator [Planctomycetota bacterium]